VRKALLTNRGGGPSLALAMVTARTQQLSAVMGQVGETGAGGSWHDDFTVSGVTGGYGSPRTANLVPADLAQVGSKAVESVGRYGVFLSDHSSS